MAVVELKRPARTRTPVPPSHEEERRDEGEPGEEPRQPASGAGKEAAPSRLVSLDAFRGLTILGMLLVNNVALDAATPRHLRHAGWNDGVNFADLVFPWFLFIVGVALSYAQASRWRKQVPGQEYALKVMGRTTSLFLLGCLVESSLAKRPVFGLGVLQLIALAYCSGALLSVLPLKPRLLAAGGLLVAHWAALRFISVPGAEPGALAQNANLITHLNDSYLSGMGLRGLVSVIPTTALVLIGTAVGDLLQEERIPPVRKAGILGGAGVGLVLVGWLWSLDLLFSKALWTAPYILFAAGWGSLTLSLMYLFIDVRRLKAWAFPLVVFGSNAIVAYVAPILVKVHILQEWTWPEAGSKLSLQQGFLHACIVQFGRVPGGWIYTLGYILSWWLMLLMLYRKKLFLRV